MIETLSIAKAATYGIVPQVLDRLARLNFLFGTNGAGKTTKSQTTCARVPHGAREPAGYARVAVERAPDV